MVKIPQINLSRWRGKISCEGFPDRITQALKARYPNPLDGVKEISELTGCSISSANRWRGYGVEKPSPCILQNVLLIARAINCDPNWLIYDNPPETLDPEWYLDPASDSLESEAACLQMLSRVSNRLEQIRSQRKR